MLTILSVAYSLHPVGEDAVGGAEQVLAMLDAGLVARGARSLVVACEGSRVRGSLIPTPRPPALLDESALKSAWEAQARAIALALDRHPVDVVHMHGSDFYGYLPRAGVPTLVTLHLPPAWYPAHALRPERPATYLHCVSRPQHRACPPGTHLLPPIENGVPVERFALRRTRGDVVVALGRICPEKGFHLALDAARDAGVAMLLAGSVFGYATHRRYFDEEIVPRLDARRRFVGPVDLRGKRRLLAGARCLLVPSLVAETSSLVAMEALAAGTPVVARPVGALADIVEHGRTGFLVEDEHEMAEAIVAASTLDPMTCRAAAHERFSADRMVAEYVDQYDALRRERPQVA